MGSGSELTIVDYSGTNEDYTITSTGGHAGGLVGSMGTGSSLIIINATNLQKTTSAFVRSAAGKYAGGLVGYNNGGSVIYNGSTSYEIKQMISGGSGEGGLFGYYKPKESSDMLTLDVSHYSIDCRLNSGTYAGG